MKISRPILVLIMALVAIVAVFGNRAALATEKKPPPKVDQPVMEQEQGQAQQQHQKQGQHQGQGQTANASATQTSYTDSNASAGSNAIGEGGNATSSNEGVENNSTTNSNFLALSLGFPGSGDPNGCWQGGHGGGQDSGKSGFLGFNWLNASCRAAALAAGSKHAAENAELKCADKVFRNAVAYNVKRKDRREVCIDKTVERNMEYMSAANNKLIMEAQLRAENEKLREQKELCLKEYGAKRDELVHCYNKLDDSTK